MTVQKQPFPATTSRAADNDGNLANIWYYLLRTFFNRTGGSGAALAAVDITVSASPFTYSTDLSGSVVVQGGTVSAISVVRGNSTVNAGVTSGVIPVMRGDQVTVTYSVLPTMTFLPSEAAN